MNLMKKYGWMLRQDSPALRGETSPALGVDMWQCLFGTQRSGTRTMIALQCQYMAD
jgi:hypothetical protein